MKFTIPTELKLQMRSDAVVGIHIRDAISVDIESDGSYTTDFDRLDNKLELRQEYIEKISNGLKGWFNSLRSDSSWYSQLDGDWLNIHGESVEDFA